jgi:hypothetical protein
VKFVTTSSKLTKRESFSALRAKQNHVSYVVKVRVYWKPASVSRTDQRAYVGACNANMEGDGFIMWNTDER